MIATIDINLNAARPKLPLMPFVAFIGSPSSVRVAGVPAAIGKWRISTVYVTANYPDNTSASAVAVKVGDIYIATVAAPQAVGSSLNGFTVSADGIDENGAAVTGYVLGKGDLVVLDTDGTVTVGETTYYLHLLDSQPATPHQGDVINLSGAWQIYSGTAWIPFGGADAYTKAETDALLAGKLGNSGAQTIVGTLAVKSHDDPEEGDAYTFETAYLPPDPSDPDPEYQQSTFALNILQKIRGVPSPVVRVFELLRINSFSGIFSNVFLTKTGSQTISGDGAKLTVSSVPANRPLSLGAGNDTPTGEVVVGDKSVAKVESDGTASSDLFPLKTTTYSKGEVDSALSEKLGNRGRQNVTAGTDEHGQPTEPKVIVGDVTDAFGGQGEVYAGKKVTVGGSVEYGPDTFHHYGTIEVAGKKVIDTTDNGQTSEVFFVKGANPTTGAPTDPALSQFFLASNTVLLATIQANATRTQYDPATGEFYQMIEMETEAQNG